MQKDLDMYEYVQWFTARIKTVNIRTMLPLFSEEKFLLFERMTDSVFWNMCVKSGCWSQHECSGSGGQEASEIVSAPMFP